MSDQWNAYNRYRDYLAGLYPGFPPDDQTGAGVRDLVFRGEMPTAMTAPYLGDAPPAPTLVANAPPTGPTVPGMGAMPMSSAPPIPHLNAFAGRYTPYNTKSPYDSEDGLLEGVPALGSPNDPDSDLYVGFQAPSAFNDWANNKPLDTSWVKSALLGGGLAAAPQATTGVQQTAWPEPPPTGATFEERWSPIAGQEVPVAPHLSTPLDGGPYSTVAQNEWSQPQAAAAGGAPVRIKLSPTSEISVPSSAPPYPADLLPAGLGWAESTQFYAGDLQRQMPRLPDENWHAQRVQEQARKRQTERAWRSGEGFSPAIDPRTRVWADTFGAQNYPGEKMPDPWMHPGRYDRLPYQDGAGVFGAIPQRLQGQASTLPGYTREGFEMMSGRDDYLSPVVEAPPWETVVKNPRSFPYELIAPRPTSWGDPMGGLACYVEGDRVRCISQGGSETYTPNDFFEPGTFMYSSANPLAHTYRIAVPGTDVSPIEEIRKKPTPGLQRAVGAASREGTLNTANPWYSAAAQLGLYSVAPWLRPMMGPVPWYVKSYETTDQNGDLVIVNATRPDHIGAPGFVRRSVATSPSGIKTIYNEGTGLSRAQTPFANLLRSEYPLINGPWVQEVAPMIDGARDWFTDFIWRNHSKNQNDLANSRPGG